MTKEEVIDRLSKREAGENKEPEKRTIYKTPLRGSS